MTEPTLTEQLAHKTIIRVELNAPNPRDGREDEARILLHHADGTALEIVGGGDDCDDWVNIELLDAEAIQALRQLQADYAYKQGVKAIEREKYLAKYLALTCEERCAERLKRGLDNFLINDAMREVFSDALYRRHPLFAEPERTIKVPCPKCHERECENATTKTLSATPGVNLGGGFKGMMEPGTAKTKARRS